MRNYHHVSTFRIIGREYYDDFDFKWTAAVWTGHPVMQYSKFVMGFCVQGRHFNTDIWDSGLLNQIQNESRSSLEVAFGALRRLALMFLSVILLAS